MKTDLKIIRWLMAFFILSLFISGFTAIPIEPQLSFLLRWFPLDSSIHYWLSKVLAAYRDVKEAHPFLLYGYDWLAFAHFVLAILFVGPFKDPVKNKWVIEFGIIACILIIPFALIAGHFRSMPFWWRLVDCSFGIIGILPLMICLKNIKLLEAEEKEKSERKETFDMLV